MRTEKKEMKFLYAFGTLLFMVINVLLCIIVLGAEPQIPLVIGCVAAGAVAIATGFTWDEVLSGMLKGIAQSLEAVLILLLIGMLVGVWLACGTVPTLIYYGLRILSPKLFLLLSMGICLFISFVIGAWGTIGTLGIALMGIGTALGLPAPLVAGSIVSGAYIGEVLSPLSDATNLAAAVVGADVFSVVKRVFRAVAPVAIITAAFYLALGLKRTPAVDGGAAAAIEALLDSLSASIRIHPVTLLPIVTMIVCLACKLPAIPSMLVGILLGAVLAGAVQGTCVSEILNTMYAGFISRSGNKTIDALLTAGGVSSMMNTISVILIAMGFGGIMQSTGQMEALTAPITKRLRTDGGVHALTAVTAIVMNILMADQYLGISVPGQMYAKEYDRRGVGRAALGEALLESGAVTSPLIPWNTCGMYVSSLLGVSVAAYMPYAFASYLIPAAVLTFHLASPFRRKEKRV